MIINFHFEKVTLDRYIEDRFNLLDLKGSIPYFIKNGVIPTSIKDMNNITDEEVRIFKNAIKPGSIHEAALKAIFIGEYNNIKLPERSTFGSLGYDFATPFDIEAKNISTYPLKVPTGIRCVFDEINTDRLYGLFLYPRSSTGIKKALMLSNCIGVIDPDYYQAENEGHIIASLSPVIDEDIYTLFFNKNEYNLDTPSTLKFNAGNTCFNAGDNFVQGIFLEVGVYANDVASNNNIQRTGGIGSTSN